MAVTTLVIVHDGSSWQTVSNASDIRLRRRLGSGEASFQVMDATKELLALLRTGRECEVAVTVDGEQKVFGGYIDRPRVQADIPRSFGIFPRVVDLSHGASWRRVIPLDRAADTKYTDILDYFWRVHWPGVDRVIVDHDLKHPERYTPGFDTLASMTNEIVGRFLPDWVWWVEHNGTNGNGISKRLQVQPRGHTDRTGSVTLTENNIGPRFPLQPVNDPRNYITVVGDDNPQEDATLPLFKNVEDNNSQSSYGVRHLVTKESEVGDTDGLQNVGESLLEQRKFDLWEGRFDLYDWNIEPGEKIALYLPTLGINNGDAGVPWIVMEVEERVSRGTVRRTATLREHNDAAYFRVT